MKTLKNFLSRPAFLLVPIFLALFVVFIQPILTFPIADRAKNGTPMVGFPLSFVEVVDSGGVDGMGYNFSILPLIVNVIFYYCLFSLLSYWLLNTSFLQPER